MSSNIYKDSDNRSLASMLHAALLERLLQENILVDAQLEQLNSGDGITEESLLDQFEAISNNELKLTDITKEMKRRNLVMGLLHVEEVLK